MSRQTDEPALPRSPTAPDAMDLVVTLQDGTDVPTRPIRPTDSAALQRFHSRLSENSIYLRFFHYVPTLNDDMAAHFTHVDGMDRYAIVALDPAQPDEIIGVVRYDRDPGTDGAEYAIVVQDGWHGKGLGLGMTRQLVAAARARGIRHFYAYVLPENRRMLNLFHDLTLPEHGANEDGVKRIDLDLFQEDREPA